VITDISTFINNITTDIYEIAWTMYTLAWGIGWLICGLPLPLYKFKGQGQDLIEDVVTSAFFLTIGTTLFEFMKNLPQLLGLSH